LLGSLLEHATELRLDALAARDLFTPLGCKSATFVNLSDVDSRARLLAERSVAATQQCPERGRLVLGEVDDLNAFAMGGIAGHAGLFSDAADVSAIAAALVASWKGAATSFLDPEIVRTFWTPAGVPGSTWRLGWDGPAAKGSQAGGRFSPGAVGHLGFTGCSLWIEPERETWVVLLSNRVHPRVPDHERFREFRPRLHDAVLEALGLG
jgi:CubicO group peptidase (beta-lactamase class C family)